MRQQTVSPSEAERRFEEVLNRPKVAPVVEAASAARGAGATQTAAVAEQVPRSDWGEGKSHLYETLAEGQRSGAQ